MTVTSEELGKLLDEIANNLVYASIHNRLHTNLCEASEEYNNEMNHYRVFWQLTINAHATTTILMLCRVYDTHKDSLNLKKLLDIISANYKLFEKDNFCERIKDRQFIDELSQMPRVPDHKIITRDIEYVSEESNPLVKKLSDFRDKQVAHTDRRSILDASLNVNTILWGEVEELLSRGIEIFNTYEGLFRASSWVSYMPGEEDYQRVLKSVRQTNIMR